jgi:hypothetical protein
MNYTALATLIQTHPSWVSTTDRPDDSTLATWVNEKVVGKTYDTLSSGAIFAVIAANISDFNALTDASKQTVRDILYIHSGEGVPTTTDSPARTLLQSIFSGTQTLADLADAISYLVSRGEDAGVGPEVGPFDVAEAVRRIG